MRVFAALFVFALTVTWSAPLTAEAQDEQPRFRASVDVVTISAVVRDKQGRFVPALTKDDFTVLDNGQKRPILEFQPDENGPISVALLVDGSGSMRHFSAVCRRVGELLLTQLNDHSDDVALLSFDSRLVRLREFTSDFQQFRSGLNEVENWGASSIYDAIAGAADVVHKHTRKRRAVVVVTDGRDNWSTLSPGEVARIASTIDVPVFVLAVTPHDDEASDVEIGGGLGEIARATGGEYFPADTETPQARALGRIVEELRHQYLLAIEPSRSKGLRTLEIQTRKSSFKVRAREWYAAEAD
ncbi:MAG TPA: VWA domain-containing protein [Vicinamibacterales bacterium]|nr:VWA domain-containing protein [Vicinamibacterales bacterium]